MSKISQISTQKLAFLGDAVYELMVRERIVTEKEGKIGELNNIKVSKVCCKAQSEFFKKLEPLFTEDELAIYKRGKNIRSGRVPKNVSPNVYYCATGLEAVFGYLYLSREISRIEEFLKFMNI